MAKREVNIKLNVDAKGAVKSTDKLGKSLDGVAESTNDVKKSTGGLSSGLGALGGGFSSAASGAAALGKRMLLLLANPIGLVIAAIAVAVLAVKTAFESSEAGQNKYNKLMGVLGALLGNLVDLLADFGELIIEAFENPQKAIKDFSELVKENISNRLEGLMELIPQLGKAISQLFSGDFAEAGKTAGNAFVKATLGVEDLSGKIEKAAEATKDFIKEQEREGKLAASVADMRAKADKIERDLLVEKSVLQSNIAQLRLKSRQEEQFSSKERREALLEAQGLEDILLDKETTFLELRRDAQVLENTFSRSNKENLDKEAAAISAVNNQVAARANTARQLQRELNTIQSQIDSEEKIQDTNRLKKELSIKESGQRQVKAELELKNLRAEQGLADPNATLEEQQAKFEELQAIKEEQFTTELEVFLEQAAIKGATEEEINAQKLLKTAKFSDSVEKIEKSRIEKIEKAEEDAAKNKENLQKLTAAGSIGVAKDVLGAVSSILDEGSAEAKAISLAQATISGFQGVQAAYTSALAIPTIGITLAPIAAAAAGVVAAKNIQKIASSKTGSKKDSGGGGGGGGFSAGSFTPISIPEGNIEAPSINTETLFSTQNLEGSDSEEVGNGRGLNQKVVVLESDITENQNRVLAVENNAQIG